MLVRLETIPKTNSSYVIDEIDRLLDEVDRNEFINCMLDVDMLEENEHDFYYVDKYLLFNFLHEK